MEIQGILKNLREKNNLTQEQLAERVQVTRQAVSRWETGETQPNTDTLKLLSRVFDVSDSQKNFVASNDISIIEAYTAITSNGYAFPFGIFEGNNPVGFVMIGYDKDDYWKDAPAIADGNYNLWRLMIDKNYQNRGYGKQAVELALRFIRTFPCGKADFCWLSYEPENAVAKSLYASFGFIETGEKDGEELIAVLKL